MEIFNFTKKILFIDTRQGGDWSLDLLFSGLVRVLGHTNIVDYPVQKKHRMGIPTLVGDAEKDWGAERMSLSYTPLFDKIPEYSPSNVKNMIRSGEIGLVIVDERPESWEQYRLLFLDSFFDIPTVVVSGHDRFWNESPLAIYEKYYRKNLLCMFLDNWRPEYSALPFQTMHYNWSTNFDHLWDPSRRSELNCEKKYDICFMGYGSHPDRLKVIDHLFEKWGDLDNCIVLERNANEFRSFLPKKQYFEKMAQSRICLNIMGAAENGKTMRFYEIPYVGSFMLSEQWTGMDSQIHPISCKYFCDLQSLDEQIDWALKNPVEREIIAAQGHVDSILENSVKYRANEMLVEIVRLLQRKSDG